MNAKMLKIPREEIDYEVDTVKLPRGEYWLYADRKTGHPYAAEFKFYTEDRELWRVLPGLDGIEQGAIYTDSKCRLFGRDFIVQSFAIREVIKLASLEPELFELAK